MKAKFNILWDNYRQQMVFIPTVAIVIYPQYSVDIYFSWLCFEIDIEFTNF